MKAILREPKKIVPMCIAALFFLMTIASISPCTVKVILYPPYREVKKVLFTLSSTDYNTIETENFSISYRDVSRERIDFIKDNAEKSLRLVMKDFNYEVNGKINLIVYPEYKEMADKIGLGSGYDAMGVYYGGVISILDPSKWIKDSSKMAEMFAVEGPMVHELTHLIVDYMTGGNVPVWFTEGIALYEEYRINKVEWAYNRTFTRFYSSKELEDNFYKLDEIKAYRQAFLSVEFIGKNYGIKGINDIIKELKSGKTMAQALKKVTGLEADELFEKSCKLP